MQDPKGQAYYPPQAQAYPQQPQPYSPQPQAYPPQPQAYAPQHNPAYTGAPVAMSPPSSTWRSGLTACCDDCFVCGLGMYLPACLYGEIYRKLHGDDFWFACCLYYWCGCFSCCFANKTRSTLRSKYGLPVSVALDYSCRQSLSQDQPPAQPPPGPVQRPQVPPWGRWLDRDTNRCLNLQRIGESMQRPLELCSYEGLEALPTIGKEYRQRYKLVNDRLPKGRQRRVN
ncbi:hypothetical protein QJQ45_030238 [Haematococcus lacustris]|nr:hypothetical protein QJQ45_030238 [Haematococcus lacustris]